MIFTALSKTNTYPVQHPRLILHVVNGNKCSAVAEMGDRFALIDMGRGLRMQAVQQAHDGKMYS